MPTEYELCCADSHKQRHGYRELLLVTSTRHGCNNVAHTMCIVPTDHTRKKMFAAIHECGGPAKSARDLSFATAALFSLERQLWVLGTAVRDHQRHAPFSLCRSSMRLEQ